MLVVSPGGHIRLTRPKATPQQVSTAWPYGVRQDRVEGKQAPRSSGTYLNVHARV